MKSILFYFGHPAQFLFAKKTIHELKKYGHKVHILIKSKDILEELVINSGFEYSNILPVKRGEGKFSILFSLIKRNIKLYLYLKKNDLDLLVGTDASIAQVGKLIGKKTITILEDDFEIIEQLARITYPFTNHILVPEPCDVGPYESKKIGYAGYMKLAYLSPGIFKPNRNKVTLPNTPYFLLRLSALSAHHDEGVRGLNDKVLFKIIKKLNAKGSVYISSENELKPEFEQYRLHLNPSDIHHYLYFSEMFISDSQSMSVEAALLGVPSIRVSDFANRISVLNELEDIHQLTFGIKPDKNDVLMQKIDELLALENRKKIFRDRNIKMLSNKINVSDFFTWFLLEYPSSIRKLEESNIFTDQFKFEESLIRDFHSY